ncbi:hypothetical protein [Lentzea sp. NPDC004782]|uniref:hypothetical protein n=1 Tax=Lentzea sp. NPDC004782 TaxID=3154458 RepID=UPI0033A000C1
MQMSDDIHFALASLPPQGLALKLHILTRLAASSDALTATQLITGGPDRNIASVWYALRALRKRGIVAMISRSEPGETDRWLLACGTENLVLAFLAAKSPPEIERRNFTPLRSGVGKLKSELSIVCAKPAKWFTIRAIALKMQSGSTGTVRKHMMELFDNGYVVRRLTDSDKPGLPLYEFRLNPEAKSHIREFL